MATLSIRLHRSQGKVAALNFVIPTGAKRKGGTCSFTFSTSQCAWAKRLRVLFFHQGNCRSLPSATPNFLLRLAALANSMRLSLRKAAHAAVSSAAWQEIRVRSSRDDKV